MKDTTTMKITKQQLADLVRGIGSVHVSTGGYEGDIAYTALGMVYQALADEILDGHSEDYEVPPVRTTAKDTPMKRLLPNTMAALPGSEAWIGHAECESGAGKDRIVIPLEKVIPAHLEFEVTEETDGTFTAVEHTAGPLVPDLCYTGFPSRKAAEQFVLAQPEAWE